GDDSETKGPDLLTGQVLRLTAGRSELRQQPLSAALDKLLHHRRQPFLFGPLSLPLGTARCLLRPALLPFLRGQVTLATLPPALLGVVDHRSDPDLPALAALPHCAGITRLVLIAALAPAVPIRKRRFTKFGLNAGGHLPPHVPFIGADMGQQVRQLIELDIRENTAHIAPSPPGNRTTPPPTPRPATSAGTDPGRPGPRWSTPDRRVAAVSGRPTRPPRARSPMSAAASERSESCLHPAVQR